MDQKNLMPIAAGPVNPTTTGELPAQLAQLSEEALQQIIGGGDIGIFRGSEQVIDTYFLVRLS
jgi:bacteriocin leader peptide (microcyclamide/patellamide family)